MQKLENHKHYELPNGATIFISSCEGEDDGLLYQPKKNNTTVHIYSPGVEKKSDIHVYYNDNLNIDMWGFRKSNPKAFTRNEPYDLLSKSLTKEKENKVLEIANSTFNSINGYNEKRKAEQLAIDTIKDESAKLKAIKERIKSLNK